MSNESKHTPNDCICGSRPTIIGFAAKQVKCILCQRSGPARTTEEQAVADWNRQTAAPELLTALKDIVAADDDGLTPSDLKVFIDDLRAVAQAAIAKAEPKP